MTGTIYKFAGTIDKRAGTIHKLAGTIYKLAGTIYKRAGTIHKLAGTTSKLGQALVRNISNLPGLVAWPGVFIIWLAAVPKFGMRNYFIGLVRVCENSALLHHNAQLPGP